MTIQSLGKRLTRHPGIFGLIFAVGLSVLIFVYRNQLSQIQGYGFVGLFLFNILGSATIFLPTPLFLTAFAAGAIYNPFLVAVIASAGSAIGELTGYAAGYGAEELLEKDLKVQRVKKWMDKYGLWALFFLAAIPNPLFDAAGIIAGATKISIKKYLIVVWLGKLIKFLVISYLGAGSIKILGAHMGF